MDLFEEKWYHMTRISFELSAELMNAGFPQPDLSAFDPSLQGGACKPSLSRLIAECPREWIDDELGGPFHFALHPHGDKEWISGYLGYEIFYLEGIGATPEEAVAYLWLTLKKEGIV